MGELIAMPNKKATTKTKGLTKNYCESCHASLLPLCALISILTAVLVSLIFSVAFTQTLTADRNNSIYKGSFEHSIHEDLSRDNFGFIELNSAALIDMIYLSQSNGLVLVTDDNNSAASADLANAIDAAQSGAEVYHYSVVTGGDKADDFMRNLLVENDSDGAPALLYVKNGSIYDRLDDIHNPSLISTFLAKYK
ncbi:hypothetical protein IJ102_02355 [Candidatus Saccharibacteria bacterium]|nr:hypothetical protein [Candidatus Saccharibacteria bacterium]